MKKLMILALTLVMTMAFVSLGFAFKKDVELDNPGGKVVFSHENHTETQKLGCKECHPAIFKQKKGADTMTMADLDAGKFCGTCHNGEKAFSTKDEANCGKCHQK